LFDSGAQVLVIVAKTTEMQKSAIPSSGNATAKTRGRGVKKMVVPD
jgi:hypothetical protein